MQWIMDIKFNNETNKRSPHFVVKYNKENKQTNEHIERDRKHRN